jgi:hypothetical protein
MKPSSWLVLATAIAGSAVTYGIHILSKQDAARPVAAGEMKSKATALQRSRASFNSVAGLSEERRFRPDSQADQSVSPSDGIPQPRKVMGSPTSAGGNPLSESQWRDQAAKVETEANHELNRLVTLLDLDAVQQDKVFSAVAQQSRYWLPGMQAGGSYRTTDSAPSTGNLASTDAAGQGRLAGSNKRGASNGTLAVPQANPPAGSLVSPVESSPVGAPDLTAYLNADQQQSIIEDEMDRQAWWAEVLPQLLPPTIADGVQVDAALTGEADPAPETKEFDGGEMLLEE